MEDPSNALIDRASALRMAGRNAEAIEVYAEAARLHPDNLKAAQHLGLLLTQAGRGAEAEPYLRRALDLAPGHASTRFALSLALKAMGRYTEAVYYGDARFELPALNVKRHPFPCPQWRSFDLRHKRVVVMTEQGYGDQILDARFLPVLAEMGAHVTALVVPELLRLFAVSFPQIKVEAATGSIALDRPDFWISAGDLMGVVGATPQTLPGTPYLRSGVAPAVVRSGSALRIGLVTRGNPTQSNDARRSLPDDVAARLAAALPGDIVGLHPDDSGARDFADTAALIDGCDLVVSVDTAAAHLAGAMGKPCLTLVPGFNCDWRWQLEPDTSPWYPTMRLFRGSEDGRWDDAVSRLIAAAAAFRR